MTDAAYVLGTHDEEIARLGLQHRVWHSRVLRTWSDAGFARGQTIVDLGCGPGYATLDLAEIVGPSGHVVAVDRSRRFLDALEHAARERSLTQIEVIEADLDAFVLRPGTAHGIWCRWAAAFVRDPRRLMNRVVSALAPGGVFVAHEYFNYSMWRFMPPLAEMDEFVGLVIDSWRASGGDPEIGAWLPGWLDALGCTVITRPFVDVIDPQSPIWPWPKAFIASGLRRLVELGRLTDDRAREIQNACATRERLPHARMVTPGVMEIVATSRR